VSQNNAKQNTGFTLIEVMIAMFILMIGMLALLNTAAVIIENNLVNVLRDEAAYVAQSTISDIRNTPFNSITSQAAVLVPRYFSGVEMNYSVTTTVTPVGTAGDSKNVQVSVTWTYKGVPYQHTINTVIISS